jgi:hypothetical protein
MKMKKTKIIIAGGGFAGLSAALYFDNDGFLVHLSPLGWEHINLTGDYVRHAKKKVAKGRCPPLRNLKEAMTRLPTPATPAIAATFVMDNQNHHLTPAKV